MHCDCCFGRGSLSRLGKKGIMSSCETATSSIGRALARELVAPRWAFALPCPALICDVAVGYTSRKNSHGDRDDFITTRIVI